MRTVADIPTHKGNDVVSAQPSSPISQAIVVTCQRLCGGSALRVSDLLQVLFNERDDLGVSARVGARICRCRVDVLMSIHTFAIRLSRTDYTGINLTTLEAVGYPPVVDEFNPAGKVSLGDTVRLLASDRTEYELDAVRGYVQPLR